MRKMAKVGRVLVWCDKKKSVDLAHELFVKTLGLRNGLEPAHRKGRGLFPFMDKAYCASVNDGHVSIEFMSVGWLSRVRHMFQKEEFAQVVAVCMEDVQPLSLIMNKPSKLESLLYLTPLMFLGLPQVHPMILCDRETRAEDKGLVAMDVDGPTTESHVKEIVFGEESTRLFTSSELFLSLSKTRLMPGLMSFQDGAEYKQLVPILRVLPSPMSSLVIKVPDLGPIREELAMQGIQLNPVRSRGGNLARLGNTRFLNGLDIRLSDSEAIDPSFVENRHSTFETYSVQFSREDMGKMGCSSVNGMEMKERFFKLPRDAILALGRTVRPQY